MRAHYYRPVQDSTGALEPNVQITIYQPGTTDLLVDTIYSDDSTSSPVSNPFITNNGIIDFYLDTPQRVRIAVVQGTNPVDYVEDQDVLSAGSDSPHMGVGGNSTQVGIGGSSTGNNSSSYGYNSDSSGTQGTAVGSASNAAGNQSTAVGSGTSANGVAGTAVGNSTTANGASGTAIGDSASARSDNHSTALGAGATTDDDNQVMVGTAADTAVFPGGVTLTGPGGARFALTIDATGALITTAL